MAQKVYLKKSSVVDKTPSVNGLDFGELAINYASGTGKSFLATKKYNGTIAKFHEDAYNEATFASKGDLSLVQSDISEIKPNYVTKAQLNAASGAAVSSAYTMAVNYVNQAVSGLSIGDYLTVSSASSVFSEINSQLSEMANSAVVESKISALTKTVEDNEYVVAQAFNDLNDRVDSIDERIGDFSGEFLTVSSASSVFADMGSGIQEAKDKAQSAYTYATIISGSVYSKTQTDSAIATAKNAAVTSAYNAAVATASAYTDSRLTTVNASVSELEGKITAVSATVTNTYWTSATTQSKIATAKAEAHASAAGSAKSYTDSALAVVSGAANTRIAGVEEGLVTTNNTISALSAGVKSMLVNVYTYKGTVANYASLPESGKVAGYVYNVEAANGNTPAGTNYAWNGTAWDPLGGSVDLTVLAASAVVKSQFDAINEDITGLENSINAVSGNITNNYATKANASSYAAAALSNAMDYTDSKVAGLSIDSYLTIASATSKFGTIDQSLTTNANNINAVSATVKNTYWTSATTQSKITEAKNAGVTSAYNASTAVTKTLSGNVESRLSTLNQSITTVSNNLAGASATVRTGYWTSATTQSKITEAKNAAVTSAFTAASAVVKTLSGNVVNAINTVASNIVALSSNTVSAINDVYKVITDNEEVTAAALNELNDDLDNLSSVFETLNGSVTSISNTVNSATGTVGTLSEDVSTLKTSASTLNDKITLINGRYISAATYTTAATTTSIANNTLTIPKPKTLVIQENDAALSTAISYDGTTALTAKTYDKKVEQANNTGAQYRPLLLGNNNHATAGSIPTTTATAGSVFNIGIYAQPSTKKIFAAGFQLTGGGTSLLTANGGSVAQSNFVATTRKVNGHALSADVTVTKGDLSLGNVENTALSTWTGNTSVKSVGTITAGTWNGTNIALNKLAKSAITIDGTSTALGGSVTTKNVLQTSNTEAKRRPLLLGVSSAATGTALATTTQTGQSFFNASIYAIPSTGKLYAGGYALTGGGTNLLTADGGSVAQNTFATATSLTGYVPTIRKVNGHALSADVTVTKGDLSLGNVENTALSTWTGNTSLKSVGTITAGTWNGTNIALNKLASSAITIDGTATALGGSITTKNVTQTNNTGAQYRPLLLGNNNHATAGSIPTTTATAGTVFNIGIYAQPSTKKLFAAGFQLTAGTANVLLGNGSSEARSNFATSSITHAEITAATANVAQKINVTADATTKHYLLGMAASGEMNSTSTHLSSAGVYWENSNLYATSDERLKDFTGDVEVDFDKLKSIPKKYFKWKNEGPQGKTDIGTSAQKVLSLYPELVSGSEDSYYGVAYDKLSILALAAIDKLHEENEELRNEIKELKERLINLEK